MSKFRISIVCLMLALAAWLGNALYAFGEQGGDLKFWSPAVVASAMIAFMILHGSYCYGRRLIFRFFVGVFLIGWMFETVSVLTGFPFGSYHYTDEMKPFLWHVPISVMPAYCVMGYVSWSMAGILLNRRGSAADGAVRFVAPVVAAFLMVLWDLSMDPLRATVEQRWIWSEGGAHFGVPLENYLGWSFVTWLMFQFFSLSLPQGIPIRTWHGLDHGSLFWVSVPLMYVAFAVEYVLNPLTGGGMTGATAVINGSPVPVETVFHNVALITSTTMLPVAVVAALMVWRPRQRRSYETQPKWQASNGSDQDASRKTAPAGL